MLQKKGLNSKIRIEDEGNGFEWKKFLELAPERAFSPNGRGIALTRMLGFGEIEYRKRKRG